MIPGAEGTPAPTEHGRFFQPGSSHGTQRYGLPDAAPKITSQQIAGPHGVLPTLTPGQPQESPNRPGEKRPLGTPTSDVSETGSAGGKYQRLDDSDQPPSPFNLVVKSDP